MDQSKFTKIVDVPGAVRQEMVKEPLPNGYGVIHRFLAADGSLIRQDYHAFIIDGLDLMSSAG